MPTLPSYDERDAEPVDFGALAVALRYTGLKLAGRAQELVRIGREHEVEPEAVARQAAAVGVQASGLALEVAQLVEHLGEHLRQDRVQRAGLREAVSALALRVEALEQLAATPGPLT